MTELVLSVLRQAAIPEAVQQVVARLREAGFRAFLVGGCVRDLLLGARPKDFDVASSALPEQVQQLFRKVIPTGIQHGTVTVLTRGDPVEVTTFRSEGSYVDGRRPTDVKFHQDIVVDLSRRDFTINAMAFDPVGVQLVDPFAGERDVVAGVIRCVGDPLERFGEDGLRSLRAVRFSAVLGFQIEPATLAAIPATISVFRKVSRERIREELTKLLLSDRPALGLRLLQQTGLLVEFLPEAADTPENRLEPRATVVGATPKILELRLAAFLEGTRTPTEALKRLTFPTKAIALVSLLLACPLPMEAEISDGDLRRFVARTNPDNIESVLALASAGQGSIRVEPLAQRIRALLDSRPPLYAKDLALDGSAVMGVLGVGPSPVVGEATRYLVDQVLTHPEFNNASFLADLLRRWSASRAG